MTWWQTNRKKLNELAPSLNWIHNCRPKALIAADTIFPALVHCSHSFCGPSLTLMVYKRQLKTELFHRAIHAFVLRFWLYITVGSTFHNNNNNNNNGTLSYHYFKIRHCIDDSVFCFHKLVFYINMSNFFIGCGRLFRSWKEPSDTLRHCSVQRSLKVFHHVAPSGTNSLTQKSSELAVWQRTVTLWRSTTGCHFCCIAPTPTLQAAQHRSFYLHHGGWRMVPVARAVGLHACRDDEMRRRRRHGPQFHGGARQLQTAATSNVTYWFAIYLTSMRVVRRRWHQMCRALATPRAHPSNYWRGTFGIGRTGRPVPAGNATGLL